MSMRIASRAALCGAEPVNHGGITCSQSHARPKVAKYFCRFVEQTTKLDHRKVENGKYFVRGTKNMLNNSPPDRKRFRDELIEVEAGRDRDKALEVLADRQTGN